MRGGFLEVVPRSSLAISKPAAVWYFVFFRVWGFGLRVLGFSLRCFLAAAYKLLVYEALSY
jgi:hypothetical protein